MRIDFLYLLTPKSHSGSLQVLPINRFSPSAPTALWAKQECSFLRCPLSYKTPHTLIHLIHNAMMWLFWVILVQHLRRDSLAQVRDRVRFYLENQGGKPKTAWLKLLQQGPWPFLYASNTLFFQRTAWPRSSVHTEQLTPFLSMCTAAEANRLDFC